MQELNSSGGMLPISSRPDVVDSRAAAQGVEPRRSVGGGGASRPSGDSPRRPTREVQDTGPNVKLGRRLTRRWFGIGGVAFLATAIGSVLAYDHYSHQPVTPQPEPLTTEPNIRAVSAPEPTLAPTAEPTTVPVAVTNIQPTPDTTALPTPNPERQKIIEAAIATREKGIAEFYLLLKNHNYDPSLLDKTGKIALELYRKYYDIAKDQSAHPVVSEVIFYVYNNSQMLQTDFRNSPQGLVDFYTNVLGLDVLPIEPNDVGKAPNGVIILAYNEAEKDLEFDDPKSSARHTISTGGGEEGKNIGVNLRSVDLTTLAPSIKSNDNILAFFPTFKKATPDPKPAINPIASPSAAPLTPIPPKN